MTGDSGTPIFDEVVAWLNTLRQQEDEPCRGCQSCLAEAYDTDDSDDQPEDLTRKQENGNTAVH